MIISSALLTALTLYQKCQVKSKRKA